MTIPGPFSSKFPALRHSDPMQPGLRPIGQGVTPQQLAAALPPAAPPPPPPPTAQPQGYNLSSPLPGQPSNTPQGLTLGTANPPPTSATPGYSFIPAGMTYNDWITSQQGSGGG